jgi:hypothetical protein
MRASLVMGCVLLGLVIGPLLLLPAELFEWNYFINPVFTWWTLGIPWRHFSTGASHLFPGRVDLALLGTVFYALAAAGFAGLAYRRFLAEPSRPG